MDPAALKILDPDAKAKIISFPNGALKKPHHHHRPPQAGAASPAPAVDLLYRECLKNHAASLGGHALDGCGEFMPSPAANPADPTSLTCAACGCHRNFHRRLPDPLPLPSAAGEVSGDDSDDDARRRTRRSSNSPPPLYLASSAPHMLMALSAGLSAPSPGPNPGRPISPAAVPGTSAGVVAPRKRFRTKFSQEQKERMLELSERLGWRMQKRDEGLVEEWCRGISVEKGVFKVWMHNNKQNYLGSARRGEAGGIGGGTGNEGRGVGAAAGSMEATGNGSSGGGASSSGNGNGNGHAVNGSSPSP